MTKRFSKSLTFAVLAFVFGACAQESDPAENDSTEIAKEESNADQDIDFQLSDYLTENAQLDARVDSIIAKLDAHDKVGQLIMPAAGRLGKSDERIKYLIKNKYIGGILMLNGTKSQFINWIYGYNQLNEKSGGLPYFYSADAEPSLVNTKIKGSTPVKKANQVTSEEEARRIAQTISKDLNDIGINYNFSPVVDMAKNRTVGYRGFGTKPENIIPFSAAFIEESQNMNIIATAKHFPGHGLVSGDTHASLQVIEGEMKEVNNYPKLIEDGVLSVMIGHLAVKNNSKYNTNGAPATVSSIIVTDLLRDSLNFQGLVVTDAMGMGGVTRVQNSSVKAIDAGCDILLMPEDAVKAHQQILAKYESDDEFKGKVEASVRRIIRMKLCLGLIE